ncbi:MAG TPA: S8 family peptidase [Paenibacillaceae bacterium]
MRRRQRRRAAVFVAVFAAAAFLVVPFLVPAPLQFGLKPGTTDGTVRHPDAGGEAAYKMQTVGRDMELTERLCRLQCEAAAVRWLRETAALPEKTRLERLRRVRREHPEWVTAAWIASGRSGRTLTDGRDPAALPAPGRGYWNTVHRTVRRGKTAQSPSFLLGGVPHFIAGIPDPQGRSGGMILLVAADVVREVERSQRRNMRLVPYPEEGRYRIESVRPEDLRDTTVREGEDNGGVSHYTVDEVVVKFRRPLRDEEILDLRRKLGLTVVRKAGRLGAVYVFRSRDKTARELMAYFKENWNPVYVEPHYLYLTNRRRVRAQAQADGGITPNDTYYAAYQWNLPAIATERGWNLTRGSDDIVVAVIDTGVQADHPDLKGRLTEGCNVINPGEPPEDDVGHGTHVAGIIAATVNNAEGVAGMTWYTKIMPIKALDGTGTGSTYSVAEAILWATDHGADVINLSLGNYAEAAFLHDAIRYAVGRGVLVVAASGNDNTDQPGYPAAYPEVLAVAATDPDTGRAYFSNYGDYIDLAAPGTNIPSTYPGGRYAALSGTSMASPHVAALIALVRAVNPALTPEEIADLLRGTATDLGSPGPDPEFGHGVIDVRRALEQAAGMTAASEEAGAAGRGEWQDGLRRIVRTVLSLLAPAGDR